MADKIQEAYQASKNIYDDVLTQGSFFSKMYIKGKSGIVCTRTSTFMLMVQWYISAVRRNSRVFEKCYQLRSFKRSSNCDKLKKQANVGGFCICLFCF